MNTFHGTVIIAHSRHNLSGQNLLKHIYIGNVIISFQNDTSGIVNGQRS